MSEIYWERFYLMIFQEAKTSFHKTSATSGLGFTAVLRDNYDDQQVAK